MKIGFYSPYLDSLSGGERYVLSLASHWSKVHEVKLFWDDPAIGTQATRRFGIDLSRVNVVENTFKTKNLFKKMIVSRGYDLLFFLSDGSIPTTFARHNILHFQVPFQHIAVHTIKLGRYQTIVCNSDFTRRNITARLGKRAVIVYPPVTAIKHTKHVKQKMILSVGRFHPLKKQDVLIETFRKGRLAGYKLVLAGGLFSPGDAYFRRLKLAAKGLAVTLLPNVSFDNLTTLYNQAAIYWHAAGYHETKPENMEHFGISTVEAMSAGAVPVAYNGGGLAEIVREGDDGFLWASMDELIDKTKQSITGLGKLSQNAKSRSKEFSTKRFTDAFDTLLSGMMK